MVVGSPWRDKELYTGDGVVFMSCKIHMRPIAPSRLGAHPWEVLGGLVQEKSGVRDL